MKRGRVEEVQFGQPRNAAAPTQTHRLTTTGPQSAGGPQIQYQLANVLKNAPSGNDPQTQLSGTAQHVVQYSSSKYLYSYSFLLGNFKSTLYFMARVGTM